MKTSTLSEGSASAQQAARIDRELDARGCESALWLAILAAERAGFRDLTDKIAALHTTVGVRRREIESCAA